MVRRNRSKIDQRSIHLYVTEKGKKLLAKAPHPAQGTLPEALERLNDNHLVQLENGLDKLIESMQVKDEKAGLIPIPEE